MKTLMALALAGTAVIATPASAVTYLFQLSGPVTATFQLDSSPTPTQVSAKGFFTVDPVVGTYNGVLGSAKVYFFDQTAVENAGGLEIDVPSGGNAIFARGGPLLFTGSLSTPTFKIGTFTLAADPNQKAQTLTISAVPESATWAMMLVGFGMIGAAVRSGRRGARVSYDR